MWEFFKLLFQGLVIGFFIAFSLLLQLFELVVQVFSSRRSPSSPNNSPAPHSQALSPMRSPSIPPSPNPPAQTPPSQSPQPAARSPKSRYKRFKRFRKALRRRSGFILAMIIVVLAIAVLIAAFFPSPHIFEGNLIVEEMSFTYAGNQANKLFFNAIRAVKKIELEGIQDQLTLTGKIQSESNPSFNKLTKLQIQLPNPKSKLIIEPVQPQTSEIEVTELRLQPNTQVNDLSYNPYGDRLGFSLRSDNSKQPNLLKLSLGEQPLKVTLEDYRLLNLKDSNIPTNAEFIITPNISEVNLRLKESTVLSFNLPKPQPGISDQWVRGNLDVRDVKFYKRDRTGNVNDELLYSTIINGKVRMAEQELAVESNQFFMAGKPGIQRLRYLQILNSEASQGIKVRFRGKSEKIEVGIDPDFPVNNIQVRFLNQYLSRDQIIALLGFSAAALGCLIPWLFDRLVGDR